VLAVSNTYSNFDGVEGFATSYPWSDQYLMVEPHLATTLSVSGVGSNEEVMWEVETTPASEGGSRDLQYAYLFGNNVVVAFNGTGFRTVRYATQTVTADSASVLDAVAAYLSTSLLSDQDRQRQQQQQQQQPPQQQQAPSSNGGGTWGVAWSGWRRASSACTCGGSFER